MCKHHCGKALGTGAEAEVYLCEVASAELGIELIATKMYYKRDAAFYEMNFYQVGRCRLTPGFSS